jgi:chorismate dehydratase
MTEEKKICARIGMVHYINVAPIHETWKEQVNNDSWELVEAHPSALNAMLASGEIDLGFVSSHEYGIRPERYRILSDLSISANGAVGSVFLFSQVPPEQLTGFTVLLSSQSKTSVSLVKIILEQFFKVDPRYIEAEVRDARKKNIAAVLAIGDDAIRLRHEGFYPYCLDLGEVWLQHTGLPFVFAVCAVREDFCSRFPEQTDQVHQTLIDCRDRGVANLSRICTIAAPRIPMDISSCHTYLSGIEYDLNNDKQRALTTFFTYLVNLREVSERALPLKIRYLR